MSKAKELVKHIDLNELYIVFGLFGLCVILSFLSPVFLSVANISNVILQASINATLACGMTFVIVSGGIDLSVGSMLAICGVVMGSILKADLPLIVALSSALLVGGFCGLVNGFLITVGKLPPFISTLGMMSIARGTALFYTGGRSISGFKLNFLVLGNGTIFGVPILIVIMVVTYLIAFFILRYTQLGRYTYAIGGNEEATRLSGINIQWYKTSVYVISGLTSGIAAIMLTARLNSAQPIAGMTYELDAIAATVIGGTSLSGGEGKIFGTIIGALIISVLRNGLNLLNVSSFIQQIVIGAVIIAAVLVDKAKKR
ncbi:MAG: ribose ABC transporter permease [bacterium]|nr:ribose ABC transporter permease [bacterium]